MPFAHWAAELGKAALANGRGRQAALGSTDVGGQRGGGGGGAISIGIGPRGKGEDFCRTNSEVSRMDKCEGRPKEPATAVTKVCRAAKYRAWLDMREGNFSFKRNECRRDVGRTDADGQDMVAEETAAAPTMLRSIFASSEEWTDADVDVEVDDIVKRSGEGRKEGEGAGERERGNAGAEAGGGGSVHASRINYFPPFQHDDRDCPTSRHSRPPLALIALDGLTRRS